MDSKPNNCNLLTKILSSYKKYCDFGFPKDPKVYLITVSKDMYQELIKEINQTYTQDLSNAWPFRIEIDDSWRGLQLKFGPEYDLRIEDGVEK